MKVYAVKKVIKREFLKTGLNVKLQQKVFQVQSLKVLLLEKKQKHI